MKQKKGIKSIQSRVFHVLSDGFRGEIFLLQIYCATPSKKEHITDAAEHDWLVLRLECAADELSAASLVIVDGHSVLVQVHEFVIYSEV